MAAFHVLQVYMTKISSLEEPFSIVLSSIVLLFNLQVAFNMECIKTPICPKTFLQVYVLTDSVKWSLNSQNKWKQQMQMNKNLCVFILF